MCLALHLLKYIVVDVSVMNVLCILNVIVGDCDCSTGSVCRTTSQNCFLVSLTVCHLQRQLIFIRWMAHLYKATLRFCYFILLYYFRNSTLH